MARQSRHLRLSGKSGSWNSFRHGKKIEQKRLENLGRVIDRERGIYAKLHSQGISEFLAALGREEVQRHFFGDYLASIYGNKNRTSGILADSTVLDNASKMSITQRNNHNGELSMEVRLIYAIDMMFPLIMPLLMQYISAKGTLRNFTRIKCILWSEY